MSKQEEKSIWTRDETWALIHCIEKNEILWNINLKEYQNKTKRDAAFAEVAKQFKSKSIADIKKKLHALRSQHCGERMKMKRKNDSYTTKWEFFNALNFMFKDVGSVGSVVDPVENENIQSAVDNAECGPSTTEDVGMEVDTNLTNFGIPESTVPRKKANYKTKRKRGKEEDTHLESDYTILQPAVEKESSTVIYAKYLAEKLNQFDEFTKAVLIHKINNLIFESEMLSFGRSDVVNSGTLSPFSHSPPPSMPVAPSASSPSHNSEKPAVEDVLLQNPVKVELEEYLDL